ncbi:EF-hand domain-containing protein [Sphingomonas sp. XXL09]|uniref:EF-hand domain-containing protein n=1 Tax=Sphingomonas sp. XXL09 TaxID=3457787 RepID=UPI00406BBBFF
MAVDAWRRCPAAAVARSARGRAGDHFGGGEGCGCRAGGDGGDARGEALRPLRQGSRRQGDARRISRCRRKAFVKLDTNGDGRLSFDEWAIKATTKFAAADRDHSGAMDPTEFATTAVKRKSPSRAKCPPAERPSTAPAETEDS